MATIDDLVRQELIEPYELPDWEARSPDRLLWISYQLWNWLESEDALHDMARAVARRTLFEHVEQMFCDFRCARNFGAGDLRRMNPDRLGVRKLHPPKLRIYGWCPQADAFVAMTAAYESDTKTDKTLNDRKRDEVHAFIERHQLPVLLGDNRVVFPQSKRS